MKPRNRVRRNGSDNPVPPQAQSPQGRAGDSADDGITLSIQYPNGREWAKVHFDGPLAARYEAARAKLGLSHAEFFSEAFKANLLEGDATRPRRNSSRGANQSGHANGALRSQSRRDRPFFNLNIAAWRLDDLRSLAHCLGMPLRELLDWGVLKAALAAERVLGITSIQAGRLSREQRLSVRRRHDLINRASCAGWQEQKMFAEIDNAALAWLPEPAQTSPRSSLPPRTPLLPN